MTITWGAFVAGLDAGLIYNSFPLMGGHLVPPDALAGAHLVSNLTENHAMVQFVHRWLGITTFGLAMLIWMLARQRLAPAQMLPLHGLALAVTLQAGLGIATLLTSVWMPLAVAHQAGALLLIAFTLWSARAVLARSAEQVPAAVQHPA